MNHNYVCINNKFKLIVSVICLIIPLIVNAAPLFNGTELQDILTQSSSNRSLFNRYFLHKNFKSSGRLLNIFGLSLLNVYSANIVAPQGEINCTPAVGPEMEHMEYLYDVYKPGEPVLVQGTINGVAFGTLMLTPCHVWKIPKIEELKPDAERGDSNAQYQLGEIYAYGLGLPVDIKLGTEWYQKAAKQGHEPATAALKLLSEHQEMGVYKAEQDRLANQVKQEKDRIAAYAAANVDQLYKFIGEGDTEAQMNLGRRYLDGNNIAKDERLGAEYLSQAAIQGNKRALALLVEYATPGIIFNGSAEAALALGYMYATGKGVAASDEEALQWFRVAASQKNTEAIDAVKLYDAKVIDKLNKLVIKGDPTACLTLAKRYLEPFDTDEQPNLNKALPLLIRSAGLGNKEALELLKYQADSGWFIKGNANAAFALGEIFLRGIGVAANSTEAIYWYNLAAKQGMMEAKKKLVEIQKLASKK